MTKLQTLALNLRRDSPNIQWGFSLVGGSDQGAPLIVTKVAFSSPVNNNLQRGDIISKIGNYDARDVRHQDAQNLFKNAGTNINVVVQRPVTNKHNTSTASSRCSSHTPLSVSPNLSPRGPQQSFNSPGGSLPPYLPTTPTPQLQQAEQYPVLTEGYYREYIPGSQAKRLDNDELSHVINQPYRTTPLVLPGAKVKREAGPTESYLRHHPNPSVRSSPHHIDHEHAMKQRVADSVIQRVVNENPTNKQIVHKQFNSPIGMYSDSNIVDTIKSQAGLIPKKFEPSLSETYKIIQEEEGNGTEVVPIQPKVFAPNKIIPGKKAIPYNPLQGAPLQNYSNSMGNADSIQQSGSFKRLMNYVMMESDY